MVEMAALAEIWRGDILESMHFGYAVICDDTGQIQCAWGDPQKVILPRSSAKMIQALPLITSGAADSFGLTPAQLALACASHKGMEIHTEPVAKWLQTLGLDDGDLRCGAQEPTHQETRNALIKKDQSPCQLHNNCSGKHAGFLTLAKHLGAGPEYVDLAHPVQRACLEAFQNVTQETSPGFGIDGCSAPNFACTIHGMARAMAHFAASPDDSPEARLHQAMRQYPELVAGPGRACTDLMQAMDGQVAIKTGAEGFFVAILPSQKLGIALKAADGATRAAECAIAALLVRLGVLDANHPATLKRMNAPIENWRGIQTGMIKPAAHLLH